MFRRLYFCHLFIFDSGLNFFVIDNFYGMCDIAALKFACMMVIEAGAVPPIASLLADIFDIRKEVLCIIAHCYVFSVL